MKIFGKYPKSYAGPIRVNVEFLRTWDRLLLGSRMFGYHCYVVLEACCTTTPTILLDRPLEQATEFHEAFAYDPFPDTW